MAQSWPWGTQKAVRESPKYNTINPSSVRLFKFFSSPSPVYNKFNLTPVRWSDFFKSKSNGFFKLKSNTSELYLTPMNDKISVIRFWK